MISEQNDRLAAEHVMGLLDGEERHRADLLLASDPSFRAAVDLWRVHFAEFDETAPALPATESLWQRIETGVAADAPVSVRPAPARVATESRFRALWDSLVFWRFAGMTAACAALLLAIATAFFADRAARQPVMVAVLVNDSNQPGAVLSTFSDGRAEFVPLGGTSIPRDHSMQVWTFPDPKGAPVSVGVINAARTVQLNLAKLPHLQSDQVFAISMEPLHGSPTGLPTGPVVLKGTASTAL
ncbi:anti-sigma factor [Microvirga antarctica]|uniref:anti-sigma factor n=1 Tax=Microvirga antarctica TaxID=2819233 RepID=UPI001B309BEB|nr:anti-sigma factor [Microvirga antarctica]